MSLGFPQICVLLCMEKIVFTCAEIALAEITLVRVKQKSSGLKNTFLNMYSTFDPNKFK